MKGILFLTCGDPSAQVLMGALGRLVPANQYDQISRASGKPTEHARVRQGAFRVISYAAQDDDARMQI